MTRNLAGTVPPGVRPALPAQRSRTVDADLALRAAAPVPAPERAAVRAPWDLLVHPAADAAADLAGALVRGDLSVHLEPVVALPGGPAPHVVAAEASVRWEHPSRGLLPPRELLPVAARAGLQRALTDAVLAMALDGASRWWAHRAPVPVVVGVAASDLRDPRLRTRVLGALTRYGLPPRALTLAVADDVLDLPGDGALHRLAGLRASGVAVAGDRRAVAGGAATARRRPPADTLTLPAALVADVTSDRRAAAVVRRAVARAHARGLTVVAGGVLDGATLDALTVLGCDAASGPAVADAMPVDGFVHWLRQAPGALVPATSVRAVPA